jgi:uroporphyrinogen-III decarboxylase
VPYTREHLIKQEEDDRIVEYILERAEICTQFEKIEEGEAAVGENGYLIPGLKRNPFQKIMLEYLVEIPLFKALYDNPERVQRRLHILDEQAIEILKQPAALNVPYVQFLDNLDGFMTNPRLFETHCLPYYQKYSELLHGQGKKVGSHTDGNIKHLLNLLAESGLDVCESFSPSPLMACILKRPGKHGAKRVR